MTILEAYSLVEHIDGSISPPCPFLLDAQGNPTTAVNPSYQTWRIRDKALLSLINSTLTPQVFSLVVGITNALKVWNTLDQRFTSTSRANILNLKLELQSPKKGNESVNGFLQKIKIARDKLLVIGVVVDNEELICIVLRGLPKEFAHFCSTIRTRSDPISYEQLSIMLQSEEQAMMEVSNSIPHSLTMYASNSKPNGNGSNSQSNMYLNQGSTKGRGRNNYNRGRGGGRSINYSPHSQGSSGGNSGFYNNANFSPQHHSQNQTNKPENTCPQCQICGKMDHTGIDCYHKMDFAFQGKNPPTKLAAMAIASNTTIIGNLDPWLTDSRASDHITANLNNLTSQSQYKGSN